MRTRCLGWTKLPAHAEPIILRDDGVDDGKISDGLCLDCIETYRLYVAEYAELKAKVPS